MRRVWILGPLIVIAAMVGLAACSRDDPDEAAGSTASTSPTTEDPADEDDPADQDEPTDLPAFIEVSQIAGDPPEEVPSALDDMNDPAFPAPLVDPSAILAGGPPPDGIPAIDTPQFEAASTVDWLEDVEPVLLLDVDGEARAYPVQIMTWHEIVNDTFGDIPVTVSYCPLCNSAIAYLREVDGRTLDFGTSGRLYNSSLVMYDRQTESLWSHFTGEAVVGVLTGTTLDTLPVSTVSWATFRDAHPEGLVLSRETGFDRDYGRNPYPGYDDVDQVPFLFDGDLDGRLPAQTRVVAIRGTNESIAIPLDDLAESSMSTATLDGEPLIVLHAPGTASALDASTIAEGRDIGTVGVYRPVADDTAVSLEPNGDGTFTDGGTGTTFDVLGVAIDGELRGTRLEPVEHLDTFWFAIAAFEPDTRIVTP